MRNNPLVPAFYYYKFAEAISAPYTSLSAYTAGAIDSQGNIIKPESSIDSFEYFVIKLKKIFEQLPYGTTKASLASYIPALQMFSEEVERFGITKTQFNFFVEGMFAVETNGTHSYFELLEDMGSANMGGPASSPAYNTGSVSGMDAPMQSGVAKRKSVLGFENSCEMFDVCPEDYEGMKSAKAWRHVPDSESKAYLQRYQRRNGAGKMAVRNSDTGEIHFLSLKPQSFVEEYGIDRLDILKENKVKDYTDTSSDPETNVATLTDNQEKKLGRGATPIEVTQKNVDDTIQSTLERLHQERGAAGKAEKSVTLQDTLRSIEPIFKTARSGSSGEERAADVLGLLKHLGSRPPSTNDPYDSARGIYNPESEDILDIIYRDTKTPTASAKIPTKDLSIEFPKVEGVPAPEAARHFRKSGNYRDYHRIRTDIITPFINRPEIRTALGDAFMRIHQGKQERISDPTKILLPGKLSVGLVKGPGKEPIDVDMADFSKDIESSEWRFAAKKGGGKVPSYTPEVTGGKYSAYRGYKPNTNFVLDDSVLRGNIGPQTNKLVQDYLAKFVNRS
jgi:hypothetical protein